MEVLFFSSEFSEICLFVSPGDEESDSNARCVCFLIGQQVSTGKNMSLSIDMGGF